MDREIWAVVMAAVRKAAREVQDQMRKTLYPNRLIVAMYLWAVWHDRCLSWACDHAHYGALFRPRKLPSVSQFSRRVGEGHFQALLQRVHDGLARRGLVTALGYMDGKPLPVSPVSKDRDAARGRVSGGWARGYKLHAYVNEHGRIVVWSVTPLNAAEQSVALEMLPHLPPAAADALALADANYDSAPLHKAAEAAAPGLRLLTPLKGGGRVTGDPRHPVTLRQMGRARRELVEAWDGHPDLARFVLKARPAVERTFGTLACTGGGLSCLPAWVRTLARVKRWVGAKIILHNARLKVREGRQKPEAA
jgi:hypothetical protein